MTSKSFNSPVEWLADPSAPAFIASTQPSDALTLTLAFPDEYVAFYTPSDAVTGTSGINVLPHPYAAPLSTKRGKRANTNPDPTPTPAPTSSFYLDPIRRELSQAKSQRFTEPADASMRLFGDEQTCQMLTRAIGHDPRTVAYWWNTDTKSIILLPNLDNPPAGFQTTMVDWLMFKADVPHNPEPNRFSPVVEPALTYDMNLVYNPKTNKVSDACVDPQGLPAPDLFSLAAEAFPHLSSTTVPVNDDDDDL